MSNSGLFWFFTWKQGSDFLIGQMFILYFNLQKFIIFVLD